MPPALFSQSLEDTTPNADPGFIRGCQIIFQDNFEKDALGDFPALWTTTLSGEVKKLKGFENKCHGLLPQSNEVIMQINEVLELENAMKRMITGHTDSGGEERANILINTIIKV